MDEQEEYEEPKWKKPLLAVIGIVCITLLLTWTITSTPLAGIVSSLHLGEELEEKVTYNNLTITFLDDTKNMLVEKYDEDGKEYAACLEGTVDGTEYSITNVYFPEITQRSFGHVRFNACNEETIVMLHSHPFGHCSASLTDRNTLRKMQVSNPSRLMMVQCEPTRISVYI